jgi:hypothetical protein
MFAGPNTIAIRMGDHLQGTVEGKFCNAPLPSSVNTDQATSATERASRWLMAIVEPGKRRGRSLRAGPITVHGVGDENTGAHDAE